jgi:hypothetical protein
LAAKRPESKRSETGIFGRILGPKACRKWRFQHAFPAPEILLEEQARHAGILNRRTSASAKIKA